MSRITSSLVFAAIVVALGAQSALAGDHATRGHPARHGSFHRLYMSYRSPWYAPSPTLPYAPEYGFHSGERDQGAWLYVCAGRWDFVEFVRSADERLHE